MAIQSCRDPLARSAAADDLTRRHPFAADSGPAWGVGACGLGVIATTLLSELPKHVKRDQDGKDDALIAGLIRDHLPRSLAWIVGAALLVAVQLNS